MSEKQLGHVRPCTIMEKTIHQLIEHFRTTLIKLVEESDQLIGHFKTTPVKLHQ